MLRFRILGSLEAHDQSDRPVVLPRRKLRLLLATLLLQANRPVAIEQIVDWLWDGSPPASATQNLHSYVSDLRKRLGANSGLETRGGHYLLRADPATVDAGRFEALVADGRQAAQAGVRELAVERLTRAMELWRSDVVLDGLSLPADLRSATARLERLRDTAEEDLYETRLALGQHRELVPELELATGRRPLAERLWAQRMLALHRSGHQAEALESYRRVHALLDAELGTRPGADLRRLQQRILRSDPGLEISARTIGPGVRPAQLPAGTASFSGRNAELSALLDRLAGPDAHTTVVAIDGMAGVGKTALAVHAAHRLSAGFPDGQIFVDLHGFTPGLDPLGTAEVLDACLRSMGTPAESIPDGVDERSALWRSRLAARRILLVLDNASGEDQVRPLLPGAPGCLVLVTSRRRLVGLDDAWPLSLDVLEAAEAAELFRRSVGADRLAAGEDARVAEAADRCGRLPLAIRLAASRLRHRPAWTMETLLSRLADRQRALDELEAGQRSVRSALELSYANVSHEHRRLYRLLGLHRGPGFDSAMARAVAGTTPLDAERLLEGLLDAHLLQQTEVDRFRFHDLVRVHASEARDDEPVQDRRAALDRLFDHYVEVASETGKASTSLAAELPNLLAVAHQAADEGRPDITLLLSARLRRHLLVRDHHDAARILHTRALESARDLRDRRGERIAQQGLADADNAQARYDSAHEHFASALEIACEIADREGEAEALRGLGDVHYRRAHYDSATRHYQEALRLAVDTGSVPEQLSSLRGLGSVRRAVGSYCEAESWYSRAVETARQGQDRDGELYALRGLGDVRHLQGDHRLAIRDYEQALEIAEEVGNRTGQVQALRGLGYARYLQGSPDLSADCFRRSLAIARDVGYRAGEMFALHGLGTVHLLRRQPAEAIDCFRQVLDLAGETGDRNYAFEALHGLGHAERLNGRPGEAIRRFDAALALAGEIGQPTDEARAYAGLAQVRGELGQVRRARSHWQRALDLLTELDVSEVEDVSADEIRAQLAATTG